MSVFKPFLSQDIIVTPFKTNKNFIFSGSEFTASYCGIDRFVGTNISGLFTESDPTTGFISSGSYQRLIYNSIKELYYTNYLSSSIGDEATLTIDSNGVLLQANNQQPSYENYLQSTLTSSRYFPTGSNNQIGVISIPTTLFGEQLRPRSLYIVSTTSGSISDDGEGNINWISGSVSASVGNIIYPHGMIILTNSTYSSSLIPGFISASNITMSFDSTYTIYETQYKCTIRENEFNLSLNPSLLSGSTLYDFATGSFFAPYITTVGLYNDNQELLAVAKLAQPLPSSRTTDTNIIILLDK